ncbi:MAG TPA: tetratricopeptide repeat protein [Burkholderiales bacterium]|nr:tetratricopeptide repeat protein [Burkholderiales bacterium]
MSSGDVHRARARYEACLPLFLKAEHASGEAFSLCFLAHAIAVAANDHAGARVLYAESLARFEGLGDAVGRAMVLNGLGGLAAAQGHASSARGYYEESIALMRQSGVDWGLAAILLNLAYAALLENDAQQAAALLCESLNLWRKIGNRFAIARVVAGFGSLAALQDQGRQAGRLFAGARRMFAEGAIVLDAACPSLCVFSAGSDSAWLDRHEAETQARLDAQGFEQGWAEGTSTPFDRLVDELIGVR